MKHLAWPLVLLIGLLTVQNLALAADAALLTEADAISRALAQQSPIKHNELRIKAQKARLDFAPHDVKNPELRMQDISTRYFDRDANHELQIGLRWQPPGYGELSEKTEKARVSLWDELVKADEQRRKLVYEVRTVYAELAMLSEGEDLALRRAELEAARFKAVEKLVALGQRPLMDRVKAQTKSFKAAREAAQLGSRRKAQNDRLALLIGVQDCFRVEALDTQVQTLAWDAALEVALRERPELSEAKAVQSYEAARYRAARLKLVPSFSFIELAYHYESKKKDSGELLFGIELPLFNWNLGELRATSLERADSALGPQATKAAIENEMKTAWMRYLEATQAFASVEEKSKEARTMLPQLIENAERQALPEDERLELQLALIDLDELRLEARYQVRSAVNTLCWVSGAENAQALGAN